MNLKVCLGCKQSKLGAEFSKDKLQKDGLQPRCKTCNKEYRQHNKGRIEDYAKEYRFQRPEYGRDWRLAHPEYDKNRCKDLQHRYRILVWQAGRREITLLLTLDEYIAKVKDELCHYCKGPLSEQGHGLDRMDYLGGYTFDNVVPCCGPCNVKKNIRREYCATKK